MFVAGGTNTGQVWVTFTRAAGISAGTVAGQYNITVNGVADEDTFDISPSVSTSHTAGSTSTKLVVSGSHFPAGVVDVTVVNSSGNTPTDCVGVSAGTASTADTFDGIGVKGDGSFSVPIEIDNSATDDEDFRYGGNCIFVVHSAGGVEGATDLAAALQPGGQLFTLSAKVTTLATLVRGTDGVEVKVEEGPVGAIVTSVSIDGTDVPFTPKATTNQATPNVTGGIRGDTATPDSERTLDADGEITLVINVKDGDGAALAAAEEATLSVNASASTPSALGTATVAITSLTLELNPKAVIQGNTVTLTGGGFGAGEVATLVIQGGEEDADAIASAVGNENVSGNYAFTFTVPDLPAGKASVTLTQDNGQIGVGELTVSTPSITIDPPSGRVGSTISVEGSGFPARSAVHITYGGLTDDVLTVAKTVGVVIADANGEWSTRFATPGDAVRGSTGNKIQAFRPMLDDANAQRQSNVVTHVVPSPSVSASPEEGLVGATITVVGEYYAPGVSVAVKINNATLSATGAVTDADGDFTIEVEIPDLAQRFPVLSVEVDGSPVLTQTIEILEPDPVEPTRDVATEFADLIADGVLESVFRFDNTTKTWAGYNPEAPAAANDLDIINSGDNLWVAVSANAEYGGQTLTPTWNQVSAPLGPDTQPRHKARPPAAAASPTHSNKRLST